MERAEMVRRLHEVYETLWRGPLGRMDDQLAPDFHDPDTPWESLVALRDRARAERGRLSTTEVRLEDIVVEGSMVAVAATRAGIEIPGERPFSISEVAIWRFDRQGRLVTRRGSAAARPLGKEQR